MLKVAVCGEDENMGESLPELVRSIAECRVSVFTSGEALLKNCREYDVLLLDIVLEGINGIETAKKSAAGRMQ